MKIFYAFALVIVLAACPAWAALQSETIEYSDGEDTMEGYVVYDASLKGERPGVVVVHDWMGLGDYAKKRADQLAELGYIAMAVDIYGKGVRPQNTEEAAAQAGKFKKDVELMRRRAKAGFLALQHHSLSNPENIAAIGYCFGGTVALEMARAGLPLDGVVTFHGGLSTPMPAEQGTVKAKVLVLHGANDPHVPPKEVSAFQKEMTEAGVDWQMVHYSGAVHSFTKEAAGLDPSTGNAYNHTADVRSWRAMKDFLNEIFSDKPLMEDGSGKL